MGQGAKNSPCPYSRCDGYGTDVVFVEEEREMKYDVRLADCCITCVYCVTRQIDYEAPEFYCAFEGPIFPDSPMGGRWYADDIREAEVSSFEICDNFRFGDGLLLEE